MRPILARLCGGLIRPRARTYVRGAARLPPDTEQEEMNDMVSLALFVKLEAKPGKEDDVEAFLNSGRALVDEEPGTIAWFAVRFGPSTFAIFDAFEDEEGREAHLSGKVAAALMENAPDLLAEEPKIEKLDVLAAKL
jgi:quinol monooxygenase YgiN